MSSSVRGDPCPLRGAVMDLRCGLVCSVATVALAVGCDGALEGVSTPEEGEGETPSGVLRVSIRIDEYGVYACDLLLTYWLPEDQGTLEGQLWDGEEDYYADAVPAEGGIVWVQEIHRLEGVVEVPDLRVAIGLEGLLLEPSDGSLVSLYGGPITLSGLGETLVLEAGVWYEGEEVTGTGAAWMTWEE